MGRGTMKLSVRLGITGTAVSMQILEQEERGFKLVVALGNGGAMKFRRSKYPELCQNEVYLRGSDTARDYFMPIYAFGTSRACYAYINLLAAVVQQVNDGNPDGAELPT